MARSRSLLTIVSEQPGVCGQVPGPGISVQNAGKKQDLCSARKGRTPALSQTNLGALWLERTELAVRTFSLLPCARLCTRRRYDSLRRSVPLALLPSCVALFCHSSPVSRIGALAPGRSCPDLGFVHLWWWCMSSLITGSPVALSNEVESTRANVTFSICGNSESPYADAASSTLIP